MPKSYSQLVNEAKALVGSVEPAALQVRLEAGERLLVLDVREPQEWQGGVIPGAQPIPRGVLEGSIEGKVPYDATVVIYCAAGGRSALAAKSLHEMGFERVENLEGGFSAWAQAGLPVQRS